MSRPMQIRWVEDGRCTDGALSNCAGEMLVERIKRVNLSLLMLEAATAVGSGPC